jgi:glycosyltransferase involved in cell wall biosynthesis
MDALISVIVPVYNVEFYLKKCIKSLVNQTYKNIEIILVDDGSFDASPSICDKFAESDKRIKVIHQTNSGVSTARNVGIDKATGEYVAFVDSDDWVPRNALETLLNGIKENDADMCYGAIKEINPFQDIVPDATPTATISKNCPDSLLSYVQKMYKTPWGKIFKRSLLNEHGIRFEKDIKFHEDTIFLYKFIQKCETLSSVCGVTYCYNRLTPNSASKKQYRDVHMWKYTVAFELEQIFIEYMEHKKVARYVFQRYLLPFDSNCRDIVSGCSDRATAINKLREACQVYEQKFNSLSAGILAVDDQALCKILSFYNRYIAESDYEGLFESLNKSVGSVKTSILKNVCKNVVLRIKSFLIFRILS